MIAKPEDREKLAGIIFAETTTLGLRYLHAERRVLRAGNYRGGYGAWACSREVIR